MEEGNSLDRTERINAIVEEYINGTPRKMILEKYKSLWNCSDSTIDKYIKEVKDLLSEDLAKDVDWLRLEYHKLYHRLLRAGKPDKAKEVLDSMLRMMGTLKIDLNGKFDPIKIIKLTPFRNDEQDSTNNPESLL